MTIKNTVLAVLITLSMALVSSAAWAGEFPARPDLLNVDHAFRSDDNLFNTASADQSWSENSASGAYGGGAGFSEGGDATTWVEVGWGLWEPDKVKRSEKKGTLSQKAWGWVSVYSYGPGDGSSYDEGVYLEDCKGSFSAKSDEKGITAPVTQGKWNFSCKNLGEFPVNLPPRVTLKIASLLDSKVVNIEDGKVKIKGKTKEAINIEED